MTYAESRLSLIRDHVADRHARGPWRGCPVCEYIETRVGSKPSPAPSLLRRGTGPEGMTVTLGPRIRCGDHPGRARETR